LTARNINREWLCERALLAPLNETVDLIDEKIQTVLTTESRTYYSRDSVLSDRSIDAEGYQDERQLDCGPNQHPGNPNNRLTDDQRRDLAVLRYPIEVLNNVNLSRFPPHKLVLKIG